VNNELRILEEFHFHSVYNSSYIADLKNELEKKGLIEKEKKKKSFDIKEKFKTSQFYKKFKIAINEREENPNKRKQSFEEIKEPINLVFTHNSSEIKEEGVLSENNEIKTSTHKKSISYTILFNDYKNVIFKVFSRLNSNFYSFDNIKNYLKINSIDELFEDKYLGNLSLNISSDTKLNNQIIYNKFEEFFKQLEIKLKKTHNPYKGSKL